MLQLLHYMQHATLWQQFGECLEEQVTEDQAGWLNGRFKKQIRSAQTPRLIRLAPIMDVGDDPPSKLRDVLMMG